MEIKVHCLFDKMVPVDDLLPHPKNRNKHGNDQIERLAKLYEHHGIRHSIIVSNQSGYIVAGHCRRLAAIRDGLKDFPVTYQDFKSDEDEYAFIQSDNAIAEWAELDILAINEDIADFGPEFDIDMLGIKNFSLDFNEEEFDPGEDEEDASEKKVKICPHCGGAL
jgi:hypothetical protein